MATKKISTLVSEGKILATTDGDEYLYIYEPDGADDANKGLAVKLATLGITGGWVEVSGWSYASSTTINVPSGAASIYAVGDQIRLKQGGAYKYFYIITVADTLLTVTGGSDYSVANAAITDAAFSKGGGVGHPGWFNYSSTVSGSSGSAGTYAETVNVSKFSIIDRNVTVNITKKITNKGSWADNLYVKMPRQPATGTAGNSFRLGASVIPVGSITPRGYGDLRNFSDDLRFEKLFGSATLTWTDIAVDDYIIINITYPI